MSIYEKHLNKNIERNILELNKIDPTECKNVLEQIHQQSTCVFDSVTLKFIETGNLSHRMQIDTILTDILADKQTEKAV